LSYLPTDIHIIAIQDFDYIIQIHCKDRVGIAYIERGDYEVIRPEDSQIILRSELGSIIQPGMKLELSIVMWQRMADQKMCPRCCHINSQVDVNGWIDWQVVQISTHADNLLTHGYGSRQCSGKFRVAKDVRRDAGFDEKQSGNGNTESGDEEMVSPASYVATVRGSMMNY
jgi:hypothetical protein